MPPLHDIYLLPVDYPLFSWDDWPDSRAALVQGGPTSAFQMACWNAIVSHLAEALEEAGQIWDPGNGLNGEYIYSVEDTKITDGFLQDYQFNRMVANINGRLPLLHWLWATDTTYRGYIGRVYVYQFPLISPLPGRPNLPDIVYPEYFTELVYRMNQIIEIMRGTWPMPQIAVSQNSAAITKSGLRSSQGALVNPQFSCISKFLPQSVFMLPSKPINTNVKIRVVEAQTLLIRRSCPIIDAVKTKIKLDIKGSVRKSAPLLFPHEPINSNVNFSLAVQRLIHVFTKHLAFSTEASTLNALPGIRAEARVILNTLLTAQAIQKLSFPFGLSAQFTSKNQAIMAQSLSLPAAAFKLAWSLQKAQTDTGKAYYMAMEHNATLLYRVEGRVGIAIRTEAREKGAVSVTAEPRSIESLPAEVEQSSYISRKITVIKGKTRPGWVEKNSHTSALSKVENFPGLGLEVVPKGKIRASCTLGTAWEPPIWHEGGLWIRQARTIKILPDGSMDLSGSGDPIAAQQESSTHIAANLDNGWLAPIWIDGGLYIRQVREVRVLEDGSLDLTGAGDEMAVRQGSGTRLATALDTAWYPPVNADGSLWIRQVYEDPVQNENGELEVR